MSPCFPFLGTTGPARDALSRGCYNGESKAGTVQKGGSNAFTQSLSGS